MAPREILEKYLNDPNSPKVFYQPHQDPKAQLLSCATISSEPGPAEGVQRTISKSAATDQLTNSSSSPTPSVLSTGESRSSYTSVASGEAIESLIESLETMSIGSLPCLLREITGCPVTFTPLEREYWYSHSVSHYLGQDLPTHAMCIFCDDTFDSNNLDPCWNRRMYHIADHFEKNMTIEQSRPDFHVMRDMWKKGCMDEELYKHCFRHTERPACEGLRDADYIPEKTKKKRRAEHERENRVVVSESRQEMRDRQRGKRSPVVGSKNSRPKTIVKAGRATIQLQD